MTPEQMTALAVPFPPEVIRTKGGGFAAKYVDHAHVTERLNQVIPGWVYEPMARTAEGKPLFEDDGGLWIWLITPMGERMPGYGEPGTMDNPHDCKKTAISDAIKNAAMRLGVALDLWKGDETERVQVQPTPRQEFDEVKHNVGNSRGPQANQRASEPITEGQLKLAKSLLSQVDDGVNVVTQHLGEYRPPEIWSKYEAMGDRNQENGLIDKLKAAKEAQMGGKKSVKRTKGQVEDDWHLAEPPEEVPAF